MPFILLIITTVLASLLTGFLNHSLNFNLQGFSIFIIFPIGAVIVGALAASGLFIGSKLQKTVIKPYFIIIAIITGLLSFFSSTFVDYKFMISDIESELKEELSLLSESEKAEFYQKFSFLNYLNEIHSHSKITISNRGRRGTEINNPIVSIISFWLSVIGGGLGGYFVALNFIGDRTKDKKAGEYRDLKYSAIISDEKYPDLEKILTEDKSIQALSKLLSDHPHNKALANTNHAKLKILKTRSTGEGQIIIEKHVQNGKNNTIAKKQEKDLKPNETEKLMQAILDINPKEKF